MALYLGISFSNITHVARGRSLDFQLSAIMSTTMQSQFCDEGKEFWLYLAGQIGPFLAGSPFGEKVNWFPRIQFYYFSSIRPILIIKPSVKLLIGFYRRTTDDETRN